MPSHKSIDWHLLTPVLLISFLGLTALGSISLSLLVSQLIFLLFGLIIFFLVSRLSFHSHLQLIPVYIFTSILLLLLPFLFGAATRGSTRWIQLGSYTLQPSEVIKPLLILIFAHFLSRPSTHFSPSLLFRYFLLLILPAFLIFKQPDLGSSLIVVTIWLTTLLASDFPAKLLALFSLLALTFTPLIWFFFQDYQKQRLLSFLHPYADPQGAGFNLIQSIISVGSGGFLGRGLGHGSQSQLQFLPERHTDFIFASWAEEAGLLGASLLLLVFLFLLKHLLTIARQAPDNFSRLTVVGVFAMIFFQAAINIGMNLGLLPITGITLPLVSAGGSSFLATMIGLGLAHHVSLHSRHQVMEIK